MTESEEQAYLQGKRQAARGQALLSLENDYHTKFYDHYFIVDKSA